MNWPGFSALSSAWLFLLLLPLLLFYFLKLRRPRLEIPSLALWRQVINDNRVNSPFQKFKRNLLLLLQLLLLCLLILAAMQPFIHSGPERAEYLPVLIDCSASMAALDKPEGESRLAVAKQNVRELIENLLPDQRMSLIAFHSTVKLLTDFTNNRRVLLDALDKLEVVEVGSRLEDAMRLTQALSRTVPIESVLIFTDGNVPQQVDFELPFPLNYQKIDPAGANIGITALNARRAGADGWDVFVRVESAVSGQSAGTIELLQDGNSIGSQKVVLDQGESERLVFTVETQAASDLEVRLTPSDPDSLASDNIAYLSLPQGRPLRVYADPELASFRHALGAIKGIEMNAEDQESAGDAVYDLMISDQPEDVAREASVSLFVGFVPDDLKSLVSIESGTATVVDWERSSSLLQHVQMADVQSFDEPHKNENVTDGDIEQFGYEVLAFGRTGPLILKRRLGARLSYHLLFHTDRSTLPYRIGFPIVVANLVQIAMQHASLSEVRGVPTGVLPARFLEANQQYSVRGPAGFELDVKSGDDALVAGIAAEKAGIYEIQGGSDSNHKIGAALFDAGETSLQTSDELEFREEISVSATDSPIANDKPLWPIFAVLGFGTLLVEWWFFQRRPGGYIRP